MEPKVISISKALLRAHQENNQSMFSFLSTLGSHYSSYSQDILLSLWELLTSPQQIPVELFISRVQYWPDPAEPTSALFVKMDYRKKFQAMTKYVSGFHPAKLDGIYPFTEILTYVAMTDLEAFLPEGTVEEVNKLQTETTPYILDFTRKKSTDAFQVRKNLIEYNLREDYNGDVTEMRKILQDLVRQFDEATGDKPVFVDGEHKEVNTFIYIDDVDDVDESYRVRFICFTPCGYDAIESTVVFDGMDEILRSFDLEQVLMAYACETPLLTNFDFS